METIKTSSSNSASSTGDQMICHQMSNPNIMWTNTNSTTSINQWSTPELVETNVFHDRIELVYTQYSTVTISHLSGQNSIPKRCYKLIHSCVDGMWNVSDPIFGIIINPQAESYQF